MPLLTNAIKTLLCCLLSYLQDLAEGHVLAATVDCCMNHANQ